MDTRILLGVDGGGTKTEAWLARAGGDAEPIILGRGKASSSNPRAVGLELALANLSEAIAAAFAAAALPVEPADVAVLAMSGAGHAAVRQQIADWAARRNLARQLEQVHDADPVLVAGTPEGWGVALIVGTGSAAIGVDRAGRREVVGGWGYWFGDEGSAYWIGRRALDAVARAHDGRRKPTPLTNAVLAHLQVAEPRAMLGALEATGNTRGAIAALAGIVTTSAAAGDDTAIEILRDAASELADTIASLATRLNLGANFPLALTGGVVCNSEQLRTELATALTSRGLAPRPKTVVANPVEGCIAIAHRVVGQK